MSQMKTRSINAFILSYMFDGITLRGVSPYWNRSAALLSFWYSPCREVSGGIASLLSSTEQKASAFSHSMPVFLCTHDCTCFRKPESRGWHIFKSFLTSQNGLSAHQKAVVKKSPYQLPYPEPPMCFPPSDIGIEPARCTNQMHLLLCCSHVPYCTSCLPLCSRIWRRGSLVISS